MLRLDGRINLDIVINIDSDKERPNSKEELSKDEILGILNTLPNAISEWSKSEIFCEEDNSITGNIKASWVNKTITEE